PCETRVQAALVPRRHFYRNDVDLPAAAAAQHCDRNGGTDVHVRELPQQIVDAGDRLAGECHYHIAFADSGSRSRTAGVYGAHAYTGRDGELVRLRDGARDWDVLPSDTDVTASNASVPHEARGDKSRRVARDREAQTVCLQNHRGVHTHDFAGRCDQRTT